MLSIIIVAWNCEEELANCLRSLAQIDNFPSVFETIVVDNASQDGTGKMLREKKSFLEHIGLRLIFNSKNVGLSAATEQAYRLAQGEWVLLCNPDIVFGKNVRGLLDYGFAHPDEIVTTEMINDDGTLQRVIHRRFPTITRVFFDFAGVGAYLDEKLMNNLVRKDYSYRNEHFPPIAAIEQPGASFLLLSRKVISKLGFIFDSQLPVWWNDVDLARRAQIRGIRRTLLSELKIKHGLGRSGSKRMPGQTQWHLFCRSMVIYARRWRMRPHLLQLVFSTDAVLNVPLVTIVQSRRRGLPNALTLAIRHAAAQMAGVLGA